jgi:hypothetical protein
MVYSSIAVTNASAFMVLFSFLVVAGADPPPDPVGPGPASRPTLFLGPVGWTRKCIDDRVVDPAHLVPELKTLVKSSSKTQLLVERVGDVPHQAVAVFDAAKSAGIGKVNLVPLATLPDRR